MAAAGGGRVREEPAADGAGRVADDNEAPAAAVTVDHAGPAAHVVVTLRDLERPELLRR